VTAVLPCASTTQLPDVQEKRHETQMQHCYTSVHTSLISSSPPRRLNAADQPGSCYTCSLAQAYDGDGGTIATIDEVNVLSACVMRTMVLRRYARLPFAVCKMHSARVVSRQVWMQLQLEHRFWKNVTGARFWKRVLDNRILLNNLRCNAVKLEVLPPFGWLPTELNDKCKRVKCTLCNKKAQLSLINPCDACEKFARFT